MQRTAITKKTARRKGLSTLAAGIGSGLLFALWWPLGVVGLGFTGYYGYKWLKYRGEWGMRF